MPTKADPIRLPFAEGVAADVRTQPPVMTHGFRPAPPACDECIRLRAELLFLAAAVDGLADLPPGLRARCRRIIDRREG
jgi:hypothetical protein